MSNPFSEHFSRDPLIQKQQEDEQQRLLEEQRILENQERQRAYKEAVVAEIQRYDSMAMQILEQLRDAGHSGMEVRRRDLYEALKVLSNYPPFSEKPGENRQKPLILQLWELGFSDTRKVTQPVWKDSSRTVTEQHFQFVVSLSLQMDGDTATSFVATYHGEHFNRTGPYLPRTVHTSLSSEALVEALIELHKPSKRTEAALFHKTIAHRVLKRVSELPSFSKIKGYSKDHFEWNCGYEVYLKSERDYWSSLEADPRLNPLADVTGQKILIEEVMASQASDYTMYSATLVTVSLVLDDQNNPTHYEFQFGKDQPAVAPLSEDALYAAIEQALTLHTEKSNTEKKPKKKKSWFGQ